MSGYQEREKFSRRTLGFSILGCVVVILMYMNTQAPLERDKGILRSEIALAYNKYKNEVLDKCVQLVYLYGEENREEDREGVLTREYVEVDWELTSGPSEDSSTGLIGRCCKCINSFEYLYTAVEAAQNKQDLDNLRRQFEVCVQEADKVLVELDEEIEAVLAEEEEAQQQWQGAEGTLNI